MSTESTELPWQRIGREKRQAIDSLLPDHWRVNAVPPAEELPDATAFPRALLSERELAITEDFAAEQLLQQLAAGHFSASEVVNAFCHRATIAHQLTNCLSEILFAEALAQAESLDSYYRTHGKTVGPLHGLPISLKDQFRVKGAETSMGYVAWLGKVETEETESWLVKQLRSLGAVVYCKTNVPTSLMALETNNNIIGYTTNAHNRLLSSGGSSGGEASLLALRGSILGLGSDVGASIRLPCALSNIVGLKPSHGRVPYLGVANSMEGHQTVESVIGPMGHSIGDLRLLLKSILSTRPWQADPKVINLPWRHEAENLVKSKISTKKLTFGVIRTDGMVNPHPPVTRAINETVGALRAAGYEVIEWDPPAHSEAFQILWDAFAADGGTDIHTTLAAAGEPPVPEIAVSYGKALGHLPVATVNDLWATQARKAAFQARYLSYWAASAARTTSGEPIDALIAPAAPSASFKPTEGKYFGYTGVFNVLDYSAAVVRSATRVDKEKDGRAEEYVPLNDFDGAVAGDCEFPC
ncbi:amidase signature domain-containing protein [Macrophomina phaseolina]|uniref:amidase n=1 Tax=Macrophomina phaseolina TaxID=35725 RepID=A0ABQ8FXY8_9PEZI|nr:amidase signature domain-containing protein [Macrophomina phaseolina]